MDGQPINCTNCRHCGNIVDFNNWDERMCNYYQRTIRISSNRVCQHLSLNDPNKQKNKAPKSQPNAVFMPKRNHGQWYRYDLIKSMICSMPDPSNVTDNDLIRIFDIANKVISKLSCNTENIHSE